MGFRVNLCASVYPEKIVTLDRVGIDVTNSIDGFLEAMPRNRILPFLGAYQRLCYSYFFFKKLIRKYRPDFILVTGGSSLIPKSAAERTIIYVHFPIDLEVVSKRYINNKFKRVYIRPWQFISNNLDYIKKATIITNSNYTKKLIRETWGTESTVIPPPCPQYAFPILEEQKQEVVCSIGRFTPEKDYETILEVACRLNDKKFELVGSVTSDKREYLARLMKSAPKNVKFHINATVQEKLQVLARSKVLLHSFIGEHFGIGLVEAMSAGVIPITHDSGAAKEDNLVPNEFRYTDLSGAVKSVGDALDKWNLSTAENLRESARKFSPDEFRSNMKRFIRGWILSKKLLIENNMQNHEDNNN
jgi:glycosyltransferase involved in cell wall biosynthesis